MIDASVQRRRQHIQHCRQSDWRDNRFSRRNRYLLIRRLRHMARTAHEGAACLKASNLSTDLITPWDYPPPALRER